MGGFVRGGFVMPWQRRNLAVLQHAKRTGAFARLFRPHGGN